MIRCRGLLRIEWWVFVVCDEDGDVDELDNFARELRCLVKFARPESRCGRDGRRQAL